VVTEWPRTLCSHFVFRYGVFCREYSDGTRTSVQASGRAGQRGFPHSRDLGGSKYFSSHWSSDQRRAAVALTLLCSDLLSGFVACFPWTRAALVAFPVLLGVFFVSGFYSGYPLTPPERLRARLLGTAPPS
jgi:hypothetical protein